MKYIDIHGHVNFEDYGHDCEEVIKRAREAQVGMITVGANTVTSRGAIELARTRADMWATVGLHPTDNDLSLADGLIDREIATFAREDKVVAIGECGLEYVNVSLEGIALQKEIFERHIALANEVGKPLMLHVRNPKSGGSAYRDAISILKAKAKVRANFHFFAGTLEDLKSILDIGDTVSFTGVITFTRDYDEIVRYVPLDCVMSETDCPFVAPVPYRGKRNEPAYVIEVVKAIARIRGEGEDVVARTLLGNAMDFFSLGE